MNEQVFGLFKYAPLGLAFDELLERHMLEITLQFESLGITTIDEAKKHQLEFHEIIRKALLNEDNEEATKAIGEHIFNNHKLLALIKTWSLTSTALRYLRTPNKKYESSEDSAPLRFKKELIGKSYLEVGTYYLLKALEKRHPLVFINEQFSIQEVAKGERKDFSSKGGVASSERWKDARDLSRELAEDAWSSEDSGGTHEVQTIGKLAKSIQKVIAADPKRVDLEEPPTIQAIKGWIEDLAPPEARKPGRPKKV